MKKPVESYIIIHIYIWLVVAFQAGSLRESFLSNFPIWFYVFTALEFFTMSQISDFHCIENRKLDPPQLKLSETCEICNISKYHQSKHCNKCGRCRMRYYCHPRIYGTCVCRGNIIIFIPAMLGDICFFGITIGYSIYSIFDSLPISKWLLMHIFTIIGIPFELYYMIQSTIYAIQVFYMVCKNSVALKSCSKLGFEYFKILSDDKNPYNLGLFNNISEANDQEPSMSRFSVDITQDPKYSLYLEEINKYWKTKHTGEDEEPKTV